MAAQKSQRKRKSAGVGDIFEVSERDLSPEPQENDTAEPEAKILKTRDSDVSESRRNSDQHNLNDEEKVTKNSENVIEKPENGCVCEEKAVTIDITDTSMSEEDNVIVIEDLSQETAVISSSNIEKPSVKSDCKGETEKNDEATISSIPSGNKDSSKATCIETESCTLSVLRAEEIITVADDEENSQDVVMVCDSSIASAKLISPQVILDDTLEDGEVNESTVEVPDTSVVSPNPAIIIKFSDTLVAEAYKPKFYKFIQSFIELEIRDADATTISVFRDSNLDPKEWIVLDDTICMTETKEEEELAKLLPVTPRADSPKKKKKKKKHQHEHKSETDLFIVDINPGVGAQRSVQTIYSTKFLINDEKQEEEKKDISKPSFTSLCFNCGNEHSLKDCPLPRNQSKISANRQKFQNKNKSRYHLEEEQKYSHLQPGKLSPNLRKALGLKKNQIPAYVYNMRTCGYPPGWLEEAKFVSSELTMFDLDGNSVKNSNSRKIKGLDPEKVVEYPGFNVPFEKDCKDEYRFHRVPPFCDEFSKGNMVAFFKKVCEKEEDNLETQDMDLDNTNEISLDDEDKTVAQDKQLDSSLDSDSNNEPILSLQDLQKKKHCLLEEIKKSGETVPWEQSSGENSRSNDEESKTEETPRIEGSKNEKEASNKSDSRVAVTKEKNSESKSKETRLEIKISESSELNESSSSSNTSTYINCVKHTTFGTPILKSASPYSTLPDPDNFMKGVSPVIDFENLPNSTGKYEQMTGVLQKVRSILKNLNKTKT